MKLQLSEPRNTHSRGYRRPRSVVEIRSVAFVLTKVEISVRHPSEDVK